MGFVDKAFEQDAAEAPVSENAAPAATLADDTIAPNATALEATARALLDNLPADIAPRYAALPIEVHDLPEPDRLAALELSDPFDLIGHFEADGETETDVDPVLAPTRLYVFRRPLLDYWAETGGSLSEALSDVLIGEIERRVAAEAETPAESAA